MAQMTAALKRAGRGPIPALAATRWAPILVRGTLVAYLLIAVAVHVSTVDTMFMARETACEPGACYFGQLNGDSLDWLADRGISPSAYALIGTAISLMIPIVGHALAAVAIWQRPTAWLPGAFLISLALCTLNASGAFYILAMEHPSWEFPLKVLLIPSLVSLFLLILLFPSGRFVPRWSFLLLVFPVIDVMQELNPSTYDRLPAWVLSLHAWSVEWGYVALALVVLWRLHVTTDRLAFRQTRLWLLGQVPLWTQVVVINLVGVDETLVTSGRLVTAVIEISYALSILCVLGSFLLAIYLYNVYDLRLLVSRSLVYTLLSVFLVSIYLLTVVTLSALWVDVGSAVQALVATAIIAAIFAPARAWLQRAVGRLLYGDRDDPYGVLTRFGRQIEQGTMPERLAHSIVSLAQDALRVPGVALSVVGAPALDVTVGTVGRGATELPVSHRGDPLGTLAIAPRSPGEAFSARDRRLMEDIARQVGIAAYTVLLSNDLRQSRERIVTAREEERRRIRRDLHDGLGPSLAALALQIEIARDAISADPRRSETILDEVLAQARDAIVDIRRLVYELRPPALDDLGLVGAIRSHASRYDHDGLAVHLELPETLPPLSAAVEVAVFRIVQESLTNVVRHARATNAIVRIAHADAALHVTIQDDGQGMRTDATPGIGLRSMHERASELGGTCDVQGAPGAGTVVRATFGVSPAITGAAR